MDPRTLKHAAFSLVFLVGLSGCANIQNDQIRTRTEGTLTGAGIGAALGTGIAAVATRGDRDAMLIGAAVGGAIGGLAGHSYGSKVAARKADYANHEAYLQGCIAELQKERRRVAASNAKTQNAIALQKAELNQLIALQRSNQPSQDKFIALNRSIDGSHKVAKKDLDRTNALIQDHVKALQDQADYPTAGTKSWRQELASLDAERMALEASIGDLNAMENTTTTMIAQAR